MIAEKPKRKHLGYDPLPVCAEGEIALLGAVLLDNVYFAEIRDTLSADDWNLSSHRRIWEHMAELAESGVAVDIVTLCEYMGEEELGKVGGRAYLFSLTENLPRKPAVTDYIRIVHEKALLRKIIGICELGNKYAMAQEHSAESIRRSIVTKLNLAFGGKG